MLPLLDLLDLPVLCTTLVGTALLASCSAASRRLRSRDSQPGTTEPMTQPPPATLRRYTLLRTTGPDGQPAAPYTTTRPPGTVITHCTGGHSRRFELTDAPLGDGTYAAEPLD